MGHNLRSKGFILEIIFFVLGGGGLLCFYFAIADLNKRVYHYNIVFTKNHYIFINIF